MQAWECKGDSLWTARQRRATELGLASSPPPNCFIAVRPAGFPAFGGEEDAVRRYAAVLGIVGVLDIPIIMVSVRLLRGIHPVVIVRNEGGSGLVDPWMRAGLAVSTLALVLLAAWLIALRMRSARLAEEVAALRREAMARGGEAA